MRHWINSVPVVRYDLDTGERWASLDAVASVCGVGRKAVENWVELGWLYADKDFGRWLVPLGDLVMFVEHGRYILVPTPPKVVPS